ncbi:dihydroorotate dehydrogenase [Pediococcus claussenii]|uniref:Dihydroorotate dehydrogenase n=1 Tax=Pediococcus claussenii (strain ATCC BAA-344 / DSM 14800 / JCM 18046 / KCTC 3811 / LMG 21948 / P06) TaxID=701521 RepID=G8PBN6_PEDCP|nr:dihydroorotate dehydrogenase [Pediococcus claussenii]AEV94785.1 dihydroorotate dehydrogenase B (NAD(+)), catalytic subunit [Pediococcus claussenii ATCC BAA-344]ANZ69981.1 dihydroorotate dehydrogenase B catalytic subunit [Pediococcus claussenii]ANZ71797.1 dihydroorotate dehydrogenase B catalytic subunit [Pediococcus claussenii]KRN20964.1 pyrD protein [Pediococcus claussenii]
MKNLEVNIAGVNLKNPFMPASGTAAYGQSLAKQINLDDLGALVIKSTTLNKKTGHPEPTTVQTSAGWLNAVGLKNPGIEEVEKEQLPWLAENYPNLPVIGSVAGDTTEEYIEVAKRMDNIANISILEINISCPNVANGGIEFGVEPSVVEELTRRIKDVTTKPVFMKLGPGVTSIVEIAAAAERGGCDGLTMINTIMGMEIDLNTRKPHLSNGTGGLSGRAIHPIAVRMIYQVRQQTKLPIIGVGGIFTAEDALELMLAGANAVQVGSARYGNPRVIEELIETFPSKMKEYHLGDINDIKQYWN